MGFSGTFSVTVVLTLYRKQANVLTTCWNCAPDIKQEVSASQQKRGDKDISEFLLLCRCITSLCTKERSLCSKNLRVRVDQASVTEVVFISVRLCVFSFLNFESSEF